MVLRALQAGCGMKSCPTKWLPERGHLATARFQVAKSNTNRLAHLTLFVLMLWLFAVSAQITTHEMALVRAEVGMLQEPTSVVGLFDAALNAHDVNAALNLFADNGFVNDEARNEYNNYIVNSGAGVGAAPTCHSGYLGGEAGASRCTYSGRNMIGDWLRQLALENIQVKETSGYEASGNNITWNLAISIDLYRGLGIAPLASVGSATIQGGKIQSLTLSLTTESIAKLSAALAQNVRGQVTTETSGVLTGIIIIGLVFPLGAVYYISRVRSLFAAVPRLERPWFLLLGGVASLFIALLLLMIRNVLAIPIQSVDMVQYLFVVLTGAFILAAMVLMKRVWTIPSGE